MKRVSLMKDQKEPIKVIVIDASAVTRYLLTEILEQAGDIKVMAAFHDPTEALNKIQDLRPQVITLDVSMSDMNSLTFLEKLMELNPTPVLIVSAITQYQSDSIVKAMELGAVGYVGKQTSQSWGGILNLADEIVDKVRAASTMQFPGSVTSGGQAAAGHF